VISNVYDTVIHVSFHRGFIHHHYIYLCIHAQDPGPRLRALTFTTCLKMHASIFTHQTQLLVVVMWLIFRCYGLNSNWVSNEFLLFTLYFEQGFECIQPMEAKYQDNIVAAFGWGSFDARCINSGPFGYPFPNTYIVVSGKYYGSTPECIEIINSTAAVAPYHNCVLVVGYADAHCKVVTNRSMVPYGCSGNIFVGGYYMDEATKVLFDLETPAVVEESRNGSYAGLITKECINNNNGESFQMAGCTAQNAYFGAALLLQYRQYSCPANAFEKAIVLSSSATQSISCIWNYYAWIESLSMYYIVGVTSAVTVVVCLSISGCGVYCYLALKRIRQVPFNREEADPLIETVELYNNAVRVSQASERDYPTGDAAAASSHFSHRKLASVSP
jgi:hypothetical protein